MNPEALQRAARGLMPDAPLPGEAEALSTWLADRIAEMLESNPALLMSHLYRVDVRERDVQAALAAPDAPAALAEALIQREIEKSQYRTRHAPDESA